MKNLVAYLFSSLLLVSCSHRIHRNGYTVKKSEYWDCDLPVKKIMPTDNAYQKIGEIDFGDCKNSKIKTEEQVLSILKKEGCAIDAEFAFIKEENKISPEKVCYQCKAEYYVKKTSIVSNPDYKLANAPRKLTHKQTALYSAGLGVIILLIFLYSSL